MTLCIRLILFFSRLQIEITNESLVGMELSLLKIILYYISNIHQNCGIFYFLSDMARLSISLYTECILVLNKDFYYIL